MHISQQVSGIKASKPHSFVSIGKQSAKVIFTVDVVNVVDINMYVFPQPILAHSTPHLKSPEY